MPTGLHLAVLESLLGVELDLPETLADGITEQRTQRNSVCSNSGSC
jgi:hypothetical protein